MNPEGVRIDCSFDDSVHPNTMSCLVYNGENKKMSVQAFVNARVGVEGSNFYSGHRADPFFMTKKHFDSVTKHEHGFPSEPWRYSWLNPTGGNLMEGLDRTPCFRPLTIEYFKLQA